MTAYSDVTQPYLAARVGRRRLLRNATLTGSGLTAIALLACSGGNTKNNAPAATVTAAGGAAGGGAASTPAARAGTAAASGASATAARSATPAIRYGGTVRVAATADPPDLDPTGNIAVGLHGVISPLYSRLVRRPWSAEAKNDSDLTVTADLADSWQQVDLQNYIFHIRDNAKWHNIAPVNGRAVTAADCKAALDAYRAGGAQQSAFDQVDSIETPDAHTLTVKMKSPYALFLDTVSNLVRHIFPPEAMSRPNGLKAEPVIGSGAFMFKEYQRGSKFTGVKNPDYFLSGVPYFDGYEVDIVPQFATQESLFRTGALDYIALSSYDDLQALLQTNPKSTQVEGTPVHDVFSPAMDLTGPPFNDVRVRRAISLASDRKGILNSIFSGRGILGWSVPWIFAQDTPWAADQLGPWEAYDVAQAKQLMSAAGYAQGFDTTMIFFPYFATMQPQIELFQAQMKQSLNINITLKQLDYTTWFTTYSGMKWHGMAWGFQIGTSSTVDDFMYLNMYSKSLQNNYYIADPNIDALVVQVRQEPDINKRRQLVKQVFDIDQSMMYRLAQPYGSGFALGNPKMQGWTTPTPFQGVTNYGLSAMSKVWFTA